MNDSKQDRPKLTSSFDLFATSKELVMKNFNVFALLYLFPFLMGLGDVFSKARDVKNGVSGGNSFGAGFNGWSGGVTASLLGVGIVLVLASVVIGVFVQVMLNVLELQAAQGKTPKISALWETAKHYFWRVIGLALLTGLMLIGGLILFIIPGFIVLRRYFLAPYYLIDKDLTISEAMKQSAADSKFYAGSIWGVLGVMLLLQIPSLIPVVGSMISLALTALYSVAPALRYQEIKKAKA